MKKKILIVSDFFKPHTSGITTYIDLTIKFLLENNFDITLLTIKHQTNLSEYEEIDKIKIIRCDPLFGFRRGLYSLNLIKRFITESKKNDYINIHYPLAEIFPLIFWINKKTIFTYHCVPFYKSILLKFIKFYFYFFGLIGMLLSKKIISLSKDYIINFTFHNLFLNKIHEISPYVLKIPNIEQNYNNNKDDGILKIGYLGRICEEKGLEYLISASEKLNIKNINHKLTIAGNNKDNRFKKYINKLANLSNTNKSIEFIGPINESEKNFFFQSLDVFILPSINSFEAFGIVQIEAMLHGVPVIASNLKGVRIPVLYTGNGYNFDINKSNELADLIIKLKNNKLKNKVSIQRNCLDHFNKKKFKESYFNLLDNL